MYEFLYGIVNIKGGTFDNYDPTSGDDVDEGSFIPKGYDVDIIDNKNYCC